MLISNILIVFFQILPENAQLRYFWTKFKESFNIGSITTNAPRKIPRKRFHDHYCLDGHLGIDD